MNGLIMSPEPRRGLRPVTGCIYRKRLRGIKRIWILCSGSRKIMPGRIGLEPTPCPDKNIRRIIHHYIRNAVLARVFGKFEASA